MLPGAVVGALQCIGHATAWKLVTPSLSSLMLLHSSAASAAAERRAEAKPSTASPAGNVSVDATARKRSSLIRSKHGSSLSAKDIGAFYNLQPNFLKEAMNLATPSHSCAGLQEELAATRSQAIMYRQSFHELQRIIQQRGSRTLLRGPTGSGKSMAVASLVEWARTSGWIVMYLPSATALMRGGYFEPRPEGSSLYDTPQSAQQVLSDMVQSHAEQLSGISNAHSAGYGSLLDLANEGLKSDNASMAVDACLSLKAALAETTLGATSSPNVLFAIDDYNALHWKTEYGRTDDQGRRVLLQTEELSLASQMQLLNSSDLGQASVLAAVSGSRGVAEGTQLPMSSSTVQFHMPRYSLVETAHALFWYWERGLAPAKPTKRQVELLHSLTNGNAKEVRLLAPKLTLLSAGLL